MSDEYTPTTEAVRGDYIALASVPSERMGAPTRSGRVARKEFDRWLAAHDAEVAARAWKKGLNTGIGYSLVMLDAPEPKNPYLAEEGDEND